MPRLDDDQCAVVDIVAMVAPASKDRLKPEQRILFAADGREFAAADSKYFELAEDELVVDGVETSASLQFLPTAALVEAAQAQVNEMVDVCVETTPTSEQLDGCPLFVVLAESGHCLLYTSRCV